MTNTNLVDGAIAPVVDLPPPIQLALARIAGCDGGGLADLTYRERSLLARFIRNVDLKNPRGPVRVAVSTLAAALHTSERTVHRTCASLQDSGWITREQVKKRSGMQIADTWLTPRALELLGLIKPRLVRAASATRGDASGLSAMSEDSQQIPGPSEKIPEQPEATAPIEELAREAPENPPAANLEATPELKIPDDLQLLREIGMKAGAIFKLMGEATRAGHRLGHIVRAAAPLIRAATFPFGYLRRLISHDRDWSTYTSAAVLREQEAKQAACAAEVEAFDAQAKAVLDNAAKAVVEAAMPVGRMLTNAAGQIVWLMRYGAVYACQVADLVKPESLRGYARVTDLAKMAQAIQGGRLFEFRLQAA